MLACTYISTILSHLHLAIVCHLPLAIATTLHPAVTERRPTVCPAFRTQKRDVVKAGGA